MADFIKLNVKTSAKEEMVEITSLINEAIKKSKFDNGICVIFVPHTTCGVTVNEDTDPDVGSDMLKVLGRLVPQMSYFSHAGGNSDAHTKTSLLGNSETLIVSKGKLCLGKWQGVFLSEFDGPRTRKVWLRLV